MWVSYLVFLGYFLDKMMARRIDREFLLQEVGSCGTFDNPCDFTEKKKEEEDDLRINKVTQKIYWKEKLLGDFYGRSQSRKASTIAFFFFTRKS